MDNSDNGEKLPNKEGLLSINAILDEVMEERQNLLGKREKSQPKGCLVFKIKNHRPYWYRVFRVKVDGKWKTRWQYEGTRKPRG